MKVKSGILCFLFAVCGLRLFGRTNELEPLLSRTFDRYQANEDRINDLVFMAESLSVEKNSDGDVKKTIRSVRKVFSKKPGRIADEHIFMEINGKRLSEKEMAEEVKKQKKRGRKSSWGDSPFDRSKSSLYEYRLAGEDIRMNFPVWIVEFKAREEKENLITGRALIRKNDYNPLAMEFSPAVLPGVIKKMIFKISYFEENGVTLPKEIGITLHVKVKFILTLADMHLFITEKYSNFQVNPGIDDSVFTDKEGK